MVQEKLVELLRCIYRTCDEEIDTMQWDAEAARVAESVLRGESIAPLVQQYLDNAPDCREEFAALVAMLRAELEIEDKEDS